MKLVLRLCLGICMCLSTVGLAVGQDSYGGYYPYPVQTPGGYGYSGYDQPYSYGYGSPYAYSEQTTPRGQAQYGYNQYPGMPGYGRYDNAPPGSGSYGMPSMYQQSNDPTLRSRLVPNQNRTGPPEVRESTRIVSPSRRNAASNAQPATVVRTAPEAEHGPLYGKEIYWDGRDSQTQDSPEVAAPQSRPTQAVNRRAPATGLNSSDRGSGSISDLSNEQKSRRSRSNVVRRDNKAAEIPPPPSSDFKWGRENSNSKEQPSQAKPSYQWGIQGKPAMIGSEPGSSQSSQGSTQFTRNDAQSSPDAGAKKFQWGKVQ